MVRWRRCLFLYINFPMAQSFLFNAYYISGGPNHSHPKRLPSIPHAAHHVCDITVNKYPNKYGNYGKANIYFRFHIFFAGHLKSFLWNWDMAFSACELFGFSMDERIKYCRLLEEKIAIRSCVTKWVIEIYSLPSEPTHWAQSMQCKYPTKINRITNVICYFIIWFMRVINWRHQIPFRKY